MITFNSNRSDCWGYEDFKLVVGLHDKRNSEDAKEYNVKQVEMVRFLCTSNILQGG